MRDTLANGTRCAWSRTGSAVTLAAMLFHSGIVLATESPATEPSPPNTGTQAVTPKAADTLTQEDAGLRDISTPAAATEDSTRVARNQRSILNKLRINGI